MNWILALASAALLIFCFPGFHLVWLAPVALVPLIVAAGRETRHFRRFLLGYAAGAVYWFVTCSWIRSTIQAHGGLSAGVAWSVFALFCLAKALQVGTFTWLAGWTVRTRFAVPAVAALWVLIEYTHAPLGFAWLHLGNAAIDMRWPMRLAPLTGVWGLSFLFAAIAAEVANLLLKRPGIPGFAVLAVLLLPLLPALPRSENPRERAILVQPNIDEAEVWTPQLFARLLAKMRELSSIPGANLLVWPEAPAPFYDDDPQFMNNLAAIARERKTYFLAGLVAHTPDGGILNSAALFDPNGRMTTRYDKVNLVPFGEFVPWPLGPIAFRVSNEAGDFRPGTRRVISPLNRHRIGTFICYESVFPNYIAGFAREGAEVLFNPSNDGWFGKTAAREQHLTIVRMRAAENARWILRDTNDGITAAIDPAGNLRQTLELYRETSAAMPFAYEASLTLYTRWGDWFVAVCLFTWGAAFGMSLWHRKRG